MTLGRILKHLFSPHWLSMRAFPKAVLDRIEQAIGASEELHMGELRFAIEGALQLPALLAGSTPRSRAEALFGELRVWDTDARSGVLIYVQLVDRRIEIVADRGIAAKVPQEQWDAICRAMEKEFAAGNHERGALAAIVETTRLLARHFPAEGVNPNELPDKPTVL
jgi:TPM domain